MTDLLFFFSLFSFFFFLFTTEEKYLKCGEQYLHLVTVALFIIEENINAI